MEKQSKCKYCVTRLELNSSGLYSEVYFCNNDKKYDWNGCHFCGRGECCGKKCESYEPRLSKHKICQNITEENSVDDFVCSKCGLHLHDWVKVNDEDWYEFEFKYCPNCGAKVVE